MTEPTHMPATPSVKGEDLEKIIYDRITWRRRLSRFQWDIVLRVKRETPTTIFYSALDRLTPETRNPATYLEAVCRKMVQEAKKREAARAGKVWYRHPCEHCGGHDHLSDLCPTLPPAPIQPVEQLLANLSLSMGSPAAQSTQFICAYCGRVHSPMFNCPEKLRAAKGGA